MKLIKGNIYFQTYGGRLATYLTRYTGTSNSEKFIHIEDKAFRSEGDSSLDSLTSREATEDEIIWYEACEKAGKTIPLQEVNSELYPIF